MSIVCSICKTHSWPGGHIGRTSMAMLCHDASNSLCPSRRLEMPALPLHGSSFKNGVRFSVHTISCGKTPCSRCSLSRADPWSPSGRKDMTGRVVRVSSMKLREAQNKPDRAFVSVSHLWSALDPVSAGGPAGASAGSQGWISRRRTVLPCPPRARPTARRRCRPPWCHPRAVLPSSRHPTAPG